MNNCKDCKDDYSLFHIVKDMISGEEIKYAIKSTMEQRLSVCNGCEDNKFGICSQCGCVIMNKIRYELSACPKQLW